MAGKNMIARLIYQAQKEKRLHAGIYSGKARKAEGV